MLSFALGMITGAVLTVFVTVVAAAAFVFRRFFR